MKISLNWVKEFTKVDLPVDELVAKISAQLGAVDEVTDLGEKYRGIVIAKVVSCEKHPDADKLSLCQIDDGGAAKDVSRDAQGHVQVVCGAPNVKAGQMVAWLPPGTTVPGTFDKEPFVLEAREIRGQLSQGMLASPKELDFGDSHAGILELDAATTIKPGDDFAEVYKLDDFIIDIENKMFTHRPDLFGILGVAREIAGIQQQAFTSPAWYTEHAPLAEAQELPLSVTNELPELVPRFIAVALSNVTIQPSPVWLQAALVRAGLKPISNVVDVTNYLMYLTGQPLHAFDYDKVKARSGGEATLVVRAPKAGEKLKLLNGKEIEPRPEAIMIATDKELISVAGIMGGADTEVDAATTSVIIECANFDMYSIRRTSMEHGLFTDAVTRFTKGQSPLQNWRVTAQAIKLLSELADARQASSVIDVVNCDDIDVVNDGWIDKEVKLSAEFINRRLGLALTEQEITGLLQNVEFGSDRMDDGVKFYAPFWRTDIELPEDIVEEVGRLYGYDKLPLVLPRRDLTPAVKDSLLELKARVRASLSTAGANEVLTYSFVPGSLLDKAGQDRAKAFEIGNALSPDLQYYRPSLLPSLLEKIHPNIKAGYDRFALFELGKAHIYGEPDPAEPDIPKEVNTLSMVYASRQPVAGAPYYQARKYLVNLLGEFRALNGVTFEPLKGADLYDNAWVEQMTAPFEPARSAVLRDREGLIWGVVGEFKAGVRRALKLPDWTAGFEIDPLLFLLRTAAGKAYVPLPRFPKVTQDITLKVPAQLGYQPLFDFVWQELAKLQPANTVPALDPVDMYQAEGDTEHKHVTLRLSLASHDRTLTDAEVNKLLDIIGAVAKAEFGAERL